ncbi:transposase family protein [Streptomyces sp. NPDC053367]|uniref:transposase family protein n=1 Tax=Streptomyces sp. NPDC053367 TaxID=3365700 RepID=UPI0037CD800A
MPRRTARPAGAVARPAQIALSSGPPSPLPYVLTVTSGAALAGAKSLTAIAEWATDDSDRLLFCCGATLRDPGRPYRAPSEATVRRAPQRIDGDTFDVAIGGWLTHRAAASRAADQDGHDRWQEQRDQRVPAAAGRRSA